MTDGPATAFSRATSNSVFAPAAAWKTLAEDTRGGGSSKFGCLLAIVPIASFTFPAIAALLLVGWVVGRVDDAPVLISGVLAAIAAVLAGWGLVQDRRDPMATDLTVGRMLGFLHLIPSVIASAIALVALSRGAADGGLGLIGLLADLVVGVLYFVAHRGHARTPSAS